MTILNNQIESFPSEGIYENKKTRKAIGFKSLRRNCYNIIQVNIKMRNITYYLIQSYLIKR